MSADLTAASPLPDHFEDKRAFQAHIVDKIQGWLHPYAATRTLDLLEYQEQNGLDGCLYEIGIYKGKYFSILVRSGLIAKARVVGIDNFQYVEQDAVRRDLDRQLQLTRLINQYGADIRLVERRSCDLSERAMFAILAEEARFISIDGSHQCRDVLWDLRIADRMLSTQGIIAVDDFLNPVSLGVTFATCHFLDRCPDLTPFASITNKLFLSRPSMAEVYRQFVEDCIMADTDEKSRNFQKGIAGNHRENVEAILPGCKILAIRM